LRHSWQETDVIDRLEMFIALASERHFGRAAEACGVTQPTLSAAIRALEDQLGVQLVFRGSRFQGLTPEGVRALDWARRIVGDARSLREEMRAAHHGLTGTVRLGVVPTALSAVVALTAPLAQAHPSLRLMVLSRTSAEILAGLEAFDLDAGLTYLEGEPLGRVVQVPLYHERYALLVSADSALAGRSRIDWSDCAGQDLCLLTPDMQNRRIVNQHLGAAGGATEARIESNSVLTLVAHVLTGRWASIVAERQIALVVNDPRLRAIPIAPEDPGHLVGLIAPHREPHTPVVQALMAACRRAAQRDGAQTPG